MLDNYDTQKHMPSKHKKENISFIKKIEKTLPFHVYISEFF